ncbi:MAG: hypothetical protein RBQ97_07530 [Acholeplasma sp.]|nr:hypothetical protein [Acholeplasma sp.]
MGINIDVTLNNRQALPGVSPQMGMTKAKMSAKESIQLKKEVSKESQMLAGLSTFMSTGSIAKGFIMSNPVTRPLAVALKTAEKIIFVGSAFNQARTGEVMLESNVRAKTKTVASFGLNVAYGALDNLLFVQPQVRRQNASIDYHREIYLRNVENQKNQFV